MAIIKQYDKRRDVTYVYESKSTWIPALKQSRAKRRLIGRLDPKTGEIVPTAQRGQHRKDTMASESLGAGSVSSDSSDSMTKRKLIETVQENEKLTGEIRELRAVIKSAGEAMSDVVVTMSKLERTMEKCAAQLEHVNGQTLRR